MNYIETSPNIFEKKSDQVSVRIYVAKEKRPSYRSNGKNPMGFEEKHVIRREIKSNTGALICDFDELVVNSTVEKSINKIINRRI